VSWFITADTEEFLAVAGEYLRADTARNSVALTVTEDLRVKAAARSPAARASAAAAGSGPDEPLFGWWRPPAVPGTESPGPVGAVFMHTPTFPVLPSSHLSGSAAAELARDLGVVAGMVRVGPVYTPPEWRGRGYAGAATAAVSQAAVDAGVREVVLYTDLANSTSNALYQRLGYRPVEDRVIFSFEPARRGLRFTRERT